MANDRGEGSHRGGSGDRPDINSASKEELMRAHGIGDELAERIIQNRPYHSAADLDRVGQISDERLDFLRDSFDVHGGRGDRSSQHD